MYSSEASSAASSAAGQVALTSAGAGNGVIVFLRVSELVVGST